MVVAQALTVNPEPATGAAPGDARHRLRTSGTSGFIRGHRRSFAVPVSFPRLFLRLIPLLCLIAAVAQAATNSPILIGAEYVLIDRDLRVRAQARELALTGISAAKHYPEHAEWGEMQPRQYDPVDFRRLDNFIREFQSAGFGELVLCLRSHSPWASKQYRKLGSPRPDPKPGHLAAYGRWIADVVERYDADGREDMPGLRRPVRYLEIGSEFSSYEPEPVADYLVMLERAYRAAHAASTNIVVMPAAFLTTTAFNNDPAPANYEAAFAAVSKRILAHGLDDMRRVLDRPDCFDALNIHSIGEPDEIPRFTRWLRWETARRHYSRPVIISDTAASPFIAWGPATEAQGRADSLGLIVPPATEADRPRLAGYFRRLLTNDPPTLRWAQGFCAEDLAKKCVHAAAADVALINTAFIEDLVWLKLPVFKAGTGNSAWSGFLDLDRRERRPGFYALQQTVRWLRDYDSIRALPLPGKNLRVFEIKRRDASSWIAWLEPAKLLLPGDPVPTAPLELPVAAPRWNVEKLINRHGQTRPDTSLIPATDRVLRLELTPTPVLIEAPAQGL